MKDTALWCGQCGQSLVVAVAPARPNELPPSPQPYSASFSPNYAGYTPYVIPARTGDCREANLALVYALVGFFCCGVLVGPYAIKKGLQARNLLTLHPEMSGRWRANAAIAIGCVDILIFLLFVLLRLAARAQTLQ